MASISDILKGKAARDEARTAELRADRENLSLMRDGALEEITTKPDRYRQYLTLQADNIRCSVGNVALTLAQMPEATRIGTTGFWHDQGRYVLDEAMKDGAKVYVPPSDPKRRGYYMGYYYDVSQTSGRPLREAEPLTDKSPRMMAALTALMDQSPVALAEDKEISSPAFYDEASYTIYINPDQKPSAVFAALATEIAYARAHERGYNKGYKRELYKLDAESVGYMVCRRFGVECSPPDAKIYQGTGSATLKKGAGHFTNTSIWNGNVSLAAHNRGANSYFGEIHTLENGDRITLTTKEGTRTYSVTSVSKISETDNSMLESTSENCVTLFTCVRDQREYRWCIRAVEI